MQVREILWREIVSGDFASLDRLPPEPDLCARYGVSRSTIRSAVASLEQAGYINRLHGLGTVINHKVRTMQMRIDAKIEFTELLQMAGYQTEVKFLGHWIEKASEEQVRLYELEGAPELLLIDKIWLADGIPAIHCTDIIPTAELKRPPTGEELGKDIFSLIMGCCGCDVAYQIAKLIPRKAIPKLQELFGIGPDEPLISIAGSGYSYDGKPIIYNLEAYNPAFQVLTFLRAKI